jgi:hypothetical protein
MPRRSPGQKLINIPMGEDFIRLINEAVVRFNYGDRAKLIREAIAEKLQRLGVNVPPRSLAIPTRIGKAGRPTKKIEPQQRRGS